MTDSALRELGRQVARGDASARARLLAARLRAGDLDEDRLRLAALAGDKDVVEVLPDLRFHHAHGCHWCLYPHGKAASVVAAVAAGRLLVPLWERLGHPLAAQAVAAAEAWVECPCEPCRMAAASIAKEIELSSRTTGDAPYLRPAYDVARAAGRPARGPKDHGAAMRASKDLDHALSIILWRKTAFSCRPEVARAARELGVADLGQKEVKAAVEEALRAWALR